ncbi:MAG: hypothetical protein CMJ23_08565 [Phycisphaerae bacterium]|nr:hypothetical protein [Phycisphaerae bacterium]
MTCRLVLIVLLSFVPSAIAEESVRLLQIPVIGTVGADVTAEGVQQALMLAKAEAWNGVMVEIDAIGGDPDDGANIASLIRDTNLETIAIIRSVGGAALPILFACDRWVVLEETSIEVPDQRGGMLTEMLDRDRPAIQTLPAITSDLARLESELRRLGKMTMEAFPSSLDPKRRQARMALARTMADPSMDLGTEPTPAAIPALDRGGDPDPKANRIRTSRQGPGITARQLSDAGFAPMIPEGIDPLASALGYAEIEAMGDSGLLLVVDAANLDFKARGRLNSIVDSMIGSLDSASSLVSAMPWSLTRARLSMPDATRLRQRFPMVLSDGGWRISPGEPARRWQVTCEDSIRRWSAVLEIDASVRTLLARSQSLRNEIEGLQIGPADRDRVTAAVACWAENLESLRLGTEGWKSLTSEASEAVSSLRIWVDTPPVLIVRP